MMGTYSSSINFWRWMVAWRRYILEWFSYPRAST